MVKSRVRPLLAILTMAGTLQKLWGLVSSPKRESGKPQTARPQGKKTSSTTR
jgi:hypothetical protein